jgi:hypothetical protein
VLYESEIGVRSAVLDQDQWLAFRIYARAVQRMYGDDADVFGQVLFEGVYLGSLARSLPADYCADLCSYITLSASGPSIHKRQHTRSKGLHDGINVFGLDAVDDEVATPGHEVAVRHDLNIGLAHSQLRSVIAYDMYGSILQIPGTPPSAHHTCPEDRRR